ncbi:hypothetical protein COBT_001064, partial [Conglomerata obtusa]
MFLFCLYAIYANCTFYDAKDLYNIAVKPVNNMVRKLTQKCKKKRDFYIVTKLNKTEDICKIANVLTNLIYKETDFHKRKFFCYRHCYDDFSSQNEFFLTYINNYFDVTDDFCQSEKLESKWHLGRGTVTSTHVALDVNDEFETEFYNYVTNIDEDQSEEKSGHEKKKKFIFISNHKINTIQKLAVYNILKSNKKADCSLLLIINIILDQSNNKWVHSDDFVQFYNKMKVNCQNFVFDFNKLEFFMYNASISNFSLIPQNSQNEVDEIRLLEFSHDTIGKKIYIIYKMYEMTYKIGLIADETGTIYDIIISNMKWYMEAKISFLKYEVVDFIIPSMNLVIGRHNSIVLSSHDSSENNFKFNFKSNLDN